MHTKYICVIFKIVRNSEDITHIKIHIVSNSIYKSNRSWCGHCTEWLRSRHTAIEITVLICMCMLCTVKHCET